VNGGEPQKHASDQPEVTTIEVGATPGIDRADLDLLMEQAAADVNVLLGEVFREDAGRSEGWQRLVAAIRYSLLQEGAKRFRPTLAMLAADALGADRERVMPFAAAVECVHTYSLIHDDLPAMDNDDFRRGLPTNHRKFDEATAILAGDALLTDAFAIIGEAYAGMPDLAVRAIVELSKAAGSHGMVGGQAIDMAAKKTAVDIEELRLLHLLKTGALIRAAAVGAAIVSDASETQIEDLSDFASALGLAFQVADDLLDYSQERPESGSYCALLGPEKTRDFLIELTEEALEAIIDWDEKADSLRALAEFNRDRIR
jgi:geranylgeranyl diphosphate synthase type II